MATKLLTAAVFFAVSQTALAGIYKWVDDEGVTHFGAQPPVAKLVDKIKLGPTGVKTKHLGNDPFAEQMQRAQAKVEAEAEAAELVRSAALAAPVAMIPEPDDGINCENAVGNGQYWAKVMEDVSAKNYSDGYVSEEKFEQMNKNLEQAKNSMTVNNCESATGKEVAFYRCLSDSENHLIDCDKLH